MSVDGANILQDADSLVAQMNEINTDIVPPDVFAREHKPSAVDYYTGLVDAWKTAEDNAVIEINPTSVSRVEYDDIELGGRDDEVSMHEVEEKIDATYNKLCSLEQTDADIVEGLTHINDYLDSIHQQDARNQITNTKSIQELRADVSTLKEGQAEIRKSITELSLVVKSIHDMILRNN